MTDEEHTLLQAAHRLAGEMAMRDLMMREALNIQLTDFEALLGMLRQLSTHGDEGKDEADDR